MSDTRQYAVPQHYAARNSRELDSLRQDLTAAQAAAAATKDGAQRQQAESTAKSIERELHAAETTARDEQRAANAAPDSFDRRYGYAANFRGSQEFMPITPYFAKPEKPKLRRTVNVTKARAPGSFAERAELMRAACAEVRRLGLLAAT